MVIRRDLPNGWTIFRNRSKVVIIDADQMYRGQGDENNFADPSSIERLTHAQFVESLFDELLTGPNSYLKWLITVSTLRSHSLYNE